jgi:hypothetical protein
MKKIIIGGVILVMIIVIYAGWNVQDKFDTMSENLKRETLSNTQLYKELDVEKYNTVLPLKNNIDLFVVNINNSIKDVDSLSAISSSKDESGCKYLIEQGTFKNLISNLDSLNTQFAKLDLNYKNTLAPDSLFGCNSNTINSDCISNTPNFALKTLLINSLNKVKLAENRVLVNLKK